MTWNTNSWLLVVVILMLTGLMLWSGHVSVELAHHQELQDLKARNFVLEMKTMNPQLTLPEMKPNE